MTATAPGGWLRRPRLLACGRLPHSLTLHLLEMQVGPKILGYGSGGTIVYEGELGEKA